MRRFFFFLNAAACIARCQCVRIRICSRTDIKISSFHEDSRNKDCKKVWNEPRALPRAHISRLFPFSFPVARPFLFCSLHLSVIPTLQGCRGGGSLWIFSFAPAMKWWTTPPFAVTPPRRRNPRLLPAVSYRKEEPHARFPPAVPPCEPYHRFLKLPRERRNYPRSHLSKSTRRYWQLT